MEWLYEYGRIYSINEKNELMAETTFILKENNEVDINHTYVNPSLRGQGVAGNMLEVVVAYLRKNGLKVTASCSYANSWFRKNKESISDVISDTLEGEDIACSINGRH